ncbi:MAG: radical SAM protein [Candidatus Omnitrophota bacterium]
MMKLDCLLIHAPKLNNFYRLYGSHMFGMVMPMGLLAIADYSYRKGIKVEVLHFGIEMINNPRFSISDYVKKTSPQVVGLSLHWHQQSYDVIELARKVKLANPRVFVILGGLTASFFHQEIIKNFDCIDGIIRGDGEIPFFKLTEAILGGNKDLSSVPNLTWRSGNNVVRANKISYVAQSEDMDKFNFTNFNLLKNHRLYVNYAKIPWLWINGVGKWINLRLSQIRKFLPIPMFRGCPVDCSFCGGSKFSQELINGRKDVAIRSIDTVVESIREAYSYGYATIFIEHLCLPDREDYFKRLFEKIRTERLKVNCIMECGPLPSPELIRMFKETFLETHSMILLSPESSSEKIRRINKGYYFSNDEFLQTLRFMSKLRIPAEVCFALGLPFETPRELDDTKRFQRFLKNEFNDNVTMRTQIIELDPGSPMYVNPSKYRIIKERDSFSEFYYQNNGRADNYFGFKLGYCYHMPDAEIAKSASDRINPLEKQLRQRMCKDFCRISNLVKADKAFFEKIISLFSRLVCHFAYLCWKIKDFNKSEIK